MNYKRRFVAVSVLFGLMLIYSLTLLVNLPNTVDHDFELANRLRIMDNIKIFYHKSFCECKIDDVISIEKIANLNHHRIYSLHMLREGRKHPLYNLSSDEYLDMTLTCDTYKSLRRGFGQKVISLSQTSSTFKIDSINFANLKKLAKTVKSLYPNWVIRVYHGGSVSDENVCEIECLVDEDEGHQSTLLDNVDFCNVKEIGQSEVGKGKLLQVNHVDPSVWKLLPLGDTLVDAFVAGEIDDKFFQENLDYNQHVQDNMKRVQDLRGFFNVKNKTQARELFKKLLLVN